MATFLTGKPLTETIYNIIWNAKDTLLIVSPYIKLDPYFKTIFNHHKDNPELHILIVFGKNENNKASSFHREDVDYFKDFPNVSIVYVPNLHGKYYGNEQCGILTSINLIDYSFDNNVEFGFYHESNFITGTSKADIEAWNTCRELAGKNDVVFIRRPVYKKKLLGKSYVKSEVLFDDTSAVFGVFSRNNGGSSKKLRDFPMKIEYQKESNERPEKEKTGYCIRTGVEIPYNPKKPYSTKGWSQWQNEGGKPYYKEKYCHRTGKPSNGRTSFDRPELE